MNKLIDTLECNSSTVTLKLGTGENISLPFSVELLTKVAAHIGVAPSLNGYNFINNLVNEYGAEIETSKENSTSPNNNTIPITKNMSIGDYLVAEISDAEDLITKFPNLNNIKLEFPHYSKDYLKNSLLSYANDNIGGALEFEYHKDLLVIRSNAYSTAVDNLAYVPEVNLLLFTYKSGDKLYGKYLKSNDACYIYSLLSGFFSIGNQISGLHRYSLIDVTEYDADGVFGEEPNLDDILSDIVEAKQ